MSLKTLLHLWNEFWFKPVSVANIAVFRIVFGLLLLWYLCGSVWPQQDLWFGTHRIISQSTNSALLQYPRIDLLLLLPDTSSSLAIFLGLLILATVLFTVGFMYRFSSLFVFFGILSLHHHSSLFCNGADVYLRLIAFLMAFAPASESLSVDGWLKRGASAFDLDHDVLRPCWIQRLIQLQLCACYFESFWAKTVGPQWWDGTAMYYISHLEHFTRLSIGWLTQYQLINVIMGWGVILVEFALAFLVWIKELRYPVLFAGLLLHISIEITMFLPQFEHFFVATYILFVDSDDFKKVMKIFAKCLKIPNVCTYPSN